MYIETLENLFHFHKSFYSEQDALWQKKKPKAEFGCEITSKNVDHVILYYIIWLFRMVI